MDTAGQVNISHVSSRAIKNQAKIHTTIGRILYIIIASCIKYERLCTCLLHLVQI